MTPLFITIAALSAMYAGMSGLCLAMERHFSQVFGRDPRPAQQRGLRIAGWLWLAVSLFFSVQAWGGVLGSFVWIAALTAMTGALVMLVAYRDGWVLRVAVLSLLVSVLAGLAWASGL